MDEETIKRAAREAVDALKLEGGVSDIIHSGKNWCIQFSAEYGQFCDEFQDQFGHDNGPLVIREKVKKHLLAQVAQLRNKGQRRVGRRGADERDRAAEAAELLKETVTQTTRAVGDVINRALGVADAGATAAVNVTETINTATTRMLEPPAPPPARAPSRTQKRTDNRKPDGVRHAKSPSTGRVTKKAATKKAAGKKGASKKRKGAASTKKAGAKKSSRKK